MGSGTRWHSLDGSVRVETRDEYGRQVLWVIDRTGPAGVFPTADFLDEFLREVYGLGFGDLVKD